MMTGATACETKRIMRRRSPGHSMPARSHSANLIVISEKPCRQLSQSMTTAQEPALSGIHREKRASIFCRAAGHLMTGRLSVLFALQSESAVRKHSMGLDIITANICLSAYKSRLNTPDKGQHLSLRKTPPLWRALAT